MKNSDKPAMPLDDNLIIDTSITIDEAMGLTKREYFAGLGIQGTIHSGLVNHEGEAARRAVVLADALLKALEET